ncbi:MAG: type II secretion system F family protein, partial [Thermodesulfobacteriota bacterium]
LRDVEGGKALAEALAAHPGVFSKLYVKMVYSGEASGSLEVIFERLVKLLERSLETRGEIKSALVYPAFLTFVSCTSIVILLAFVIPRFASIFTDIGVELPVSTEILLGLSRIVVRYWWLMLLFIFSAVVGCRYYINTPSGKYVWDDFLLRLPVIGGLIQRIEVARFSRTLGTILNGGVPILESLEIVSEIATNKVIVDTIGAVQVKVKRGESIGASLKGNTFIPKVAVEMISVGEETGRLPEILIEMADRFDREVSEHIKRLLSFLEPSLILIMGLIVGSIVVSMLLAIFSINEIPF